MAKVHCSIKYVSILKCPTDYPPSSGIILKLKMFDEYVMGTSVNPPGCRGDPHQQCI